MKCVMFILAFSDVDCGLTPYPLGEVYKSTTLFSIQIYHLFQVCHHILVANILAPKYRPLLHCARIGKVEIVGGSCQVLGYKVLGCLRCRMFYEIYF